MKQTLLVSAIEAVLNQLSGVIVATVVWQVAAPFWGFTTTWGTSIELSLFFMVISVARSLLWRRMFEVYLTTWLAKRLG